MNAKLIPALGSTILGLCLGCATASKSDTQPPPSAATPTVIDGHWSGTFYQDSISKGYPMELLAEPASDGFAVTLNWPTLDAARTVGTGYLEHGRLVWTETKLVSGRGVALDGRYTAAFVDDNTLVGKYRNESEGTGFFTLSRMRTEESRAEPAPRTDSNTQVSGKPGEAAPPLLASAHLQDTHAGDDAWQNQRRIRVLYAGWKGGSRESVFQEFLGHWFDHVGVIGLNSLSMTTAADYDVVIADWGSQYGNDGYPKHEGRLDVPRIEIGPEFTKPVVAMDFVSSSLRGRYKLDWL